MKMSAKILFGAHFHGILRVNLRRIILRLFFRTLAVVLLSFTFVMIGNFACLASPVGFTKEAVPSPIIDEGNMFSPEQEKSLSQTIIENQGKYDLFFVIETVPSLNGQKLEEASLSHANGLKIGQAGKDNGVLIFLSRDDHKIRFELGRGVSTKVNDTVTTAIIDSKVTPAFKNENYVEGLTKGMTAVGENYTGAPSSDFVSIEGDKLILVTVVVVCGGIAIGLLIMVLHSIFGKEPRRIRKEIKEREDSYARLQALKAFVSKFKFSEKIDSYKALKDEKMRFEFLQTEYPDIANILKAHFSSESPSTALIDRYFYKDTYGLSISFTGKSTTPSSLKSYKLYGTGFENMSIEAANKIISTEKEKAAKVMAKEHKRKEQARAVWDAIPKPVKKALKKAKTQNERLALLSGQVADDFSASYAYIASMFLTSSSSSSSSTHYGSSSSSSSSSSSNYNSSSYDSGSYGGGSFDGGGGSGSW